MKTKRTKTRKPSELENPTKCAIIRDGSLLRAVLVADRLRCTRTSTLWTIGLFQSLLPLEQFVVASYLRTVTSWVLASSCVSFTDFCHCTAPLAVTRVASDSKIGLFTYLLTTVGIATTSAIIMFLLCQLLSQSWFHIKFVFYLT